MAVIAIIVIVVIVGGIVAFEFAASTSTPTTSVTTTSSSSSFASSASTSASSSISASSSNAAQTVTIETDFGTGGRYAGIYVAMQEGYYSARGLTVKVVEGTNGGQTISAVSSNGVNFGIGLMSGVVGAVLHSEPVIGIGVINNHSPQCLVSLSKENITQPSQLVGKSIGVGVGSQLNDLPALLALFAKYNVNPAQVNITYINTQLITPDLISGALDVIDAYSGSALPATIDAAQAQGESVNTMCLADYGINMYGDLFLTSTTFASNNPTVVQNFIQATFQGYQEAMSLGPSATAQIVVKYNGALNSTIVQQQWQETEQDLNATGVALGCFQQSQFQDTINALAIPQAFPNATSLSPGSVYTNQYLKC